MISIVGDSCGETMDGHPDTAPTDDLRAAYEVDISSKMPKQKAVRHP